VPKVKGLKVFALKEGDGDIHLGCRPFDSSDYGEATNMVGGKKDIEWMDALMKRIPKPKTVKAAAYRVSFRAPKKGEKANCYLATTPYGVDRYDLRPSPKSKRNITVICCGQEDLGLGGLQPPCKAVMEVTPIRGRK
jgi:hypothetical protein